MVLDTSALVAILVGEPEQGTFIRAIERAELRLLSAASWVETSIVIECRYGPAGLYHLDYFLTRARAETVDVDVEQARIARGAFQRYGKGRHPAALNFGDCFAYALATRPRRTDVVQGQRFRADGCCPRGSSGFGLMNTGVLYIAYDGMLEPLGQSQVLAYLEPLAADRPIHLLSFEKAEDWRDTAVREAIAVRIATTNGPRRWLRPGTSAWASPAGGGWRCATASVSCMHAATCRR